MEATGNNLLIIIGLSNLVISGLVWVLVKSKLILADNPEFGKLLTRNILKYSVILSISLIIIGALSLSFH